MLERELIQSRGMRNTWKDDEVTGFEFRLRMPSYRGMAASLLDGISVTVDNLKTFDETQVSFVFGTQAFSLSQLQESNSVRWQLTEAATIRVTLPGGLEPGVHELEVNFSLRMSYIPIEHQPSRYRAIKKVTIVR